MTETACKYHPNPIIVIMETHSNQPNLTESHLYINLTRVLEDASALMYNAWSCMEVCVCVCALS